MITNAQNIKETVSMSEVLDYLGYSLNSKQQCACPVHVGKDRNFHVKNGYGRCFSQCNQSWDNVGLIMEVKSVTFPEAIEILAGIGKLYVQYADDTNRVALIEQAKLEKSEKEKLSETLKHVCDLYAQYQSKYDIDLATALGGRGYSAETLANFGVFYTGAEPVLQKPLSDYISSMLKLGVVKKKDMYLYEPFRNRIVFTIKDDYGRVCGLAGRKLNTDNSDYPKWLNSDESLIYNKSTILYGLHQSKKSISQNRTVFLVEGYMDCMTMHEFGFTNTVASCGTAFTDGQAKILKRYADRVVMLYDGDDAGLKAARNATETLLKNGLYVDVGLMPKKEDPDSFLRDVSKKSSSTNDELRLLFTNLNFKNFLQEKIQDALVWRVMENFVADDMFSKNACQILAAQLISSIKERSIADGYVTLLSKKMGQTRSALNDSVKELQGKQLERKHSDKTNEQKRDIEEYGLFLEKNRYYICSDTEHLGFEVSNFIINPLMLIIGSDRSWRLVEVKNDRGKSFTADIDSDAFVDIASLKKELERRGNFIYKGKPEYFTKIKSKIYNETQECFPVNALGWHNAGFWVFGNGIISNGVFKKINEYGIVEHGDLKYFLPAFAKVKTGSDEEDNSYEDEREFIYVEGHTPSFQEWTRRFLEVHGANGMMGISYYITALYRDIIYSKFQYFPHLNLFGPPGAGKSFMAWSIGAMFGKAKTPFHLVQGTQVGFFRRLAKVRNGISWFDEYSNDVDFKRVEALKAAYDGVGHEKGSKDNEHEVKRTKVKSACIISGQQQPTQDVALFKRCISLNFPRFERDDKRDALGRELKDMEQKNTFGQFTGMLQKFRGLIETDFSQEFDKVRAEVSPAVAHDKTVEDRILNNHLIPLTVFRLLQSQLEFSFSYEDFRNWTINNIIEQSGAISNQDELSTWWRIFNYLVEMDLLKHEIDFIVSEHEELTLMQKGGKGTVKKVFLSKKMVLFIRFEKSFPLYLEYHKRQMTKNGLPETSLKHYLRGYDSFLGEIKGKKFNGNTKYCWAFDMDEIGLNIPLSKLFLAQEEQDRINPVQETADFMSAVNQDNLPF